MILLFLFIWLLPSSLWAAITLDTITSGEGIAGTVTVSHTAASDSTVVLGCAVERHVGLSIGAGPSITYAGNAMTLVPGATITQATRIKASLFYYLSPSAGASNVVLTPSTSADRYILSVITLKGAAVVDTFNTAGTFGSDTATNIDIDGLASAVGEFSVLCGLQNTNAPVVSPDATATVSTEQLELDHTDSTGLTHFIYTEDGAATSINMRVDSTTATHSAAVAVSIRPESTTPSFGPLRRRS